VKRSYTETVDFLFSILPMYQRSGQFVGKIDLSKTLQLLAALGSPHEALQVVHVAGTNGKGSVSHAIATMLTASGKRTALYTSPHYVDYRERIRIDGEKVPEQYVIDFVAQHEALIDEVDASFFEFTVAMAFAYFAAQKVDYAVIEVGMGGRLDSTNVVDPILSVITNIGFDHTEVLGDTLPKIASEKAGIIKPRRPVLIGEYQRETWPVFVEKARQESATIGLAEDAIDLRQGGSTTLVYDDERPFRLNTQEIELRGPFGLLNLRTALAAYQVLAKAQLVLNGASQSKADSSLLPLSRAAQALSKMSALSGYRGRFFTLSQSPKVLADAGHNADAWKVLGPEIAKQTDGKLHVVCGFVSGKNPNPFFEAFPQGTSFYLGDMSIPRNRPVAETLSLLASKYQPSTFASIALAFEEAKSSASADDLIFVGGSTFVVGELFEYLNLG
jgi:dihydrofolate synthase/folylpolyglutamate synthase